MTPKRKAIKSGILFNKLVDLKITAPDIVLEICKAKNKEIDIVLKKQVKEYQEMIKNIICVWETMCKDRDEINKETELNEIKSWVRELELISLY